MGFQKPDLENAKYAIRASLAEISSPYNDGFTSAYCKHDLYQLKCWLEDEYKNLPTFVGEEAWEQERVLAVLKR